MNFDQYMQTYLSPSVYSLLCEVAVHHETSSNGEVPNVLVDGLLNWSALSPKLTATVNTGEGYKHRVLALASVFHEICHYYTQISETDFEKRFGRYFKWTAEPSKAVKCLSIIRHARSTGVNHALLIITSIIERALGDVVLLRSTQCPCLLSDLLVMTELEDILSHEVVQLLQTLMGSPLSLNLRNIVWHGFVRPGELDIQYVYVMLCVTASVGKLLGDQHIDEIPHRDMVEITVPTVFSDFDLSRSDDAMQLFAHSAFVAPSVVKFWHLSLELYASCQYGECVVVLLPQLELALRRVFVAVNRCSERILTAENTVLYTTFDEILDKLLPDGSENQLLCVIGKPCLTLLLDCFNYPLGPCVRNHVSHGEVLLSDMSKDTALHLVCICIAFASKFCSPDFKENIELIQSVCAKAESYESFYHPISVLKQQTLLVARSLSLWHLMPRPAVDDLVAECTKDNMDKTTLVHTKTENECKAVENYVTVLLADDIIDKSDCYQLLILDTFTAEVEKLMRSSQLNTLYRYHHCTQPTREEEIIRLLIRIGKLCVCLSEQILDIAENRYRLWQAKQLRSRQRTNYKKFLLTTLPVSLTIRLIVVVILITIQAFDELKHEAVKQKKLIKFFKCVQKYCENMLSYTRTDANRWDEAEALSCNLCTTVQLLKLVC